MVLMASVGVRHRKINYPLIIGLFIIMGGGGWSEVLLDWDIIFYSSLKKLFIYVFHENKDILKINSKICFGDLLNNFN